MGDFNINLINYNDDKNTGNFLDTMFSQSFLPYITTPTRITRNTKTLIDNICYNKPLNNIISGNLSSIISDHLIQFLIEHLDFSEKSSKMINRQRCYKNFDKLRFKADLVKVNWDGFCLTSNPNDALAHFLKMVNKLLDKHAPYKTMRYSKPQYETKPWITPGLANSIRNKNKLYKRFCKDKNPKTKEYYEKQFKSYCNHISSLLRETKDSYYKQYFEDNKNNLRLVWQFIKGIINMKKKFDESTSSLLIDGQIITSAKEISNHFNNFFTSVAEKINKNIAKPKQTHLSYLGHKNNNTIFLSPTLPEDIEDLISSMKTNKASGPNSIPTKILKLFRKEFSKPLSDIINLSFNQGVFPNLHKIAIVTPIHKKGDKLDCNNYRPIFLLSNITKIYEKCMHIRLANFLRINKLLFSHQFCFRNGYSTNHALTSLIEMIREALDEDKFACGYFIDLQKAFDSIDHDILLSKLNHYGIRGASYQWFKSYLNSRQQYTTIAQLK